MAILKRLLRGLLYVVFLLIVTEGGLRVLAHFALRTPLIDIRRFVGDDLLKWKLNPGYQGPIAMYPYGRINRNGCLGEELEEPKGRDLTRIVIVGGSVVFGTGSSCMETNFCHVLQQMLNQAANENRYEVVNAGVPGYSSWHGRQFVEHRLASLQPDILIFAFGWNDSLHDLLEDKSPLDPNWRSRILVQGLDFIYSAAAIGYVIRLAVIKVTDFLHATPKVLLPDGPGVHRVSLSDFRVNLEAVRAWCLRYSIPLVLMTEPEGKSSWDYWPEMQRQHQLYLNVIREVGAESGVPVADAAAVFDHLNTRQLFRDLKDDPLHPNDRGQEVMAEAVLKSLVQAGYLNPN